MITKMIPKTIVCEDFAAMSLESAKLMASAVKARPDALLSLAAGNTAIEAYRCLKDMADRGEIDFSKAKFVALDEWLDLKDESENCISFMFKNFYGPLKIPRENITLFDVHADDLQKECSRIDQVIFDHGGIDFVLLGAGMNGHLGLNEPGSDFNGYTKVAELDPVTMQVGQKYFSKQTALTRGITLGIRHFTESKNVVLHWYRTEGRYR